MRAERRKDVLFARVVDAGLHVWSANGRVRAWHFLRTRGVRAADALRLLSPAGPRRDAAAAPQQPAPETAGTPEAADQLACRRQNHQMAEVCEQGVRLNASHGRQYAESLLRMYGLKTGTIMRVLFDEHNRRRR